MFFYKKPKKITFFAFFFEFSQSPEMPKWQKKWILTSHLLMVWNTYFQNISIRIPTVFSTCFEIAKKKLFFGLGTIFSEKNKADPYTKLHFFVFLTFIGFSLQKKLRFGDKKYRIFCDFGKSQKILYFLSPKRNFFCRLNPIKVKKTKKCNFV